jgi:hypothetical protein
MGFPNITGMFDQGMNKNINIGSIANFYNINYLSVLRASNNKIQPYSFFRTALIRYGITKLVISLVSSVAVAETTVYGKAHISVASLEDNNGSSTAITSHSSRFGVQGKFNQEGGAEVFYKLEWQVDMADVSKDSHDSNTNKTKNHFKSRNQYIGIRDSWGELRLGRYDSPYKRAGKKSIEFFSDTYVDYNNIVNKGQDVRANNSILYATQVGPGKISLMYMAGDDTTAGGNAGDMRSFAYDLHMGAFVVALATQTINRTLTNNETGNKLVLGYTINKAIKIGVLFETVKDDLALNDKNNLLSFKYRVGKDEVKFVYGAKDMGLVNRATMAAIAYDYKINKLATAYALLANATYDGLKDNAKLAGGARVIGAGMIIKF